MSCVVRARSSLLVVALLCMAAPANASAGEESHAMELVWQAVNLALLVAVLVYFTR